MRQISFNLRTGNSSFPLIANISTFLMIHFVVPYVQEDLSTSNSAYTIKIEQDFLDKQYASAFYLIFYHNQPRA